MLVNNGIKQIAKEITRIKYRGDQTTSRPFDIVQIILKCLSVDILKNLFTLDIDASLQA